MNVIIICLIITISIVLVWDYFEFPITLLAQILHTSKDNIFIPRPLGCSTCMNVWITLGILLVMNWKLTPLCLVFGFITPHVLGWITLINRTISLLIGQLNTLLSFIEKRTL